jgi:hypothetical protein
LLFEPEASADRSIGSGRNAFKSARTAALLATGEEDEIDGLSLKAKWMAKARPIPSTIKASSRCSRVLMTGESV